MKKNFLGFVGVSLALAMAVSGCSNGDPAASNTGETRQEAAVTEQTEEPKENGTTAGEMKAEGDEFREIIDMAGRAHTIPDRITKVTGYNAMAQSMMYTFAPECIASLGSKPSEGEAYFFIEEVKALPVVGDNSGKNIMNPEEVVALGPDIILHVTPINEANLSLADEFQKQINIPVIVVDSAMDTIDESYRFLGELLGLEDRGKEYADYARAVMDDVAARAAVISEEDRVKVYYAEGDDGLKTDPEGSDHSRAFTAVNAKNVAVIEDFDAYYGRAAVSMEQILEWDPEVVVFSPDDSIFSSKSVSICQDLKDGKDVNVWQSVPAIQNGRFCEAPYGIANAIDRPASVNLLYGYRWLGNLLYPEIFDYDMAEVTKEFYSMFYHYELSEEEVETLLSRASFSR